MRSSIVVAVFIIVVATVALAGSPAQLVGSVEAVYHEGVVWFQFSHEYAISISVKVYDLDTDALIYDSGPRAQTIVTWPAGHDANGSYRYVVTAWNSDGQVVVSQAAANKMLTPIAAISFDTIPANTKLLGPNEVIVDTDLQVGDPEQFRVDLDVCSSGSGAYWRDEAGASNLSVEPDCDGDGIWMYSVGPGGYFRFQSQGTGGEADLEVYGTSDFRVITANTGNASVLMPGNAVYDAEIFDEPGVGGINATDTVSLTTSDAAVLTRTMIVPSSGYFFVASSVKGQISHVTGTTSFFCCGVTLTATSVPSDQGFCHYLHSGNPTGTYQAVISPMDTFSTSGSDTIYVSCRYSGGSTMVFDRSLNVAFFPTAYGAIAEMPERGVQDAHMDIVESGVEGYVSPNAPLTQAEIEAEQGESVAANLARIQAELAEIQAQFDAYNTPDANAP